MIVVEKFDNALNKVDGDAEAVPGKRNNSLFQVEYIVENILINIKETVSNLDDKNGQLEIDLHDWYFISLKREMLWMYSPVGLTSVD